MPIGVEYCAINRTWVDSGIPVAIAHIHSRAATRFARVDKVVGPR